MIFWEAIRLALDTIRVQKLKSFFTALGVCIGVMFLITVVSIVDGMGRYMEEELVGKLIALNSFELRHRPNINIGDVPRETWLEYSRRPRILESDVEPVVAELPGDALWAMYSMDRVQVESQFSRPRSGDVTAIDGQYFEIKKLGVAEGRRFSPYDLSNGNPVVIIGPDLAKRLFPSVNPIDRQVKMGGKMYTVIGVGESLGSAFGVSFDNYIYAPFRSPIHRLLNRQPHVIDGVIVQVATAEQMPAVMESVRSVMRARHKLRPAQKDNFTLETSDSALAFW
ncbi:MAG: ABC transporter permease, partial [Gemmatimonadaceae bacterium]|nr:ABC transporter permease [Gemmatimonadaceae bacterium]